jgi:hypothetical protein
MIPLDPGAAVYLYADVQTARPVLELFPIAELKDKRAAQMLDKTSTAYAALYSPKSGRRFQLVAWGKYPKAQADIAFFFTKDWKKRRSHTGSNYWYSRAERLSVAMTAGQAFISATQKDAPERNNMLSDPFGSGLQGTVEFKEARKGSTLACWLMNPGPLVDNIFASMNLPLQIPAEQIYVSLFLAAGTKAPANENDPAQKYEVLLCIKTPSANQAQLIAGSISLLRLFSGVSSVIGSSGPDILSALLLANAPVQDGSKLKIKSAQLGIKELSLLFEQISLYSITK